MNLLLVFLLLSSTTHISSASSFAKIIDNLKLINSSMKGIAAVNDSVEYDPEMQNGYNQIDSERKVIKFVKELSEGIEKLIDMRYLSGYQLLLLECRDRMLNIDKRFKLFKEYTSLGSLNDSTKHGLMSFVEAAVSHSDSVFSNLLKLNIFVLGSESKEKYSRKGFFEIVNILANPSSVCKLSQSPSQFLISVFSSLIATQFKAYVMLKFSWYFLRLNNKGKFIEEDKILDNSFLEQVLNQADRLKNSFDDAMNSYWKCDPLIHKDNETYTEITKFLQGYVINEVDMNKNSSCIGSCEDYTRTKQYGCYMNTSRCNDQPKCQGDIVGCRHYFDEARICFAQQDSTRIYDNIRFGEVIFGEVDTLCEKSTTSYSWREWIIWDCSSCYCYCDDEANSDRYFNLRPVISDVGNNKVITGLRFIKVNRIIHLQIQQGVLIGNATIDENTTEWLPVDSYNIADSNIKPDVDYHKLTWEHRAIDLDDILVPENYVVTGIKFRRLGGHLNLEVQATSFNFTTGKLIEPSNSTWIHKGNEEHKELKLIRPDIPTRSQSNTFSETNHYINFQHSDDLFDAAQTAVPFIDIQEVSPVPPVPLIGIGIYYKGSQYSGGFIAPKVFTYKNYKDLSHFQQYLKEINATFVQHA